MKRIFLLLLSLICLLAASAEDQFFNGIIEDGIGRGVKGVKIWLSDKHQYTKSDKHGKFGLEKVVEGDTLHLEFRKSVYAIPVGKERGMRIILSEAHIDYSPDTQLANYGYGWVSRRDNTGTQSGITGERLVATGQSNILDALAGLVPGLDVSPTGGVKIRGTISFDQTQPLFIVDGNYVSSLDFVNIHSVDHVEVLKDATIYGSRGAAGAILVFTKRGN